ncbi:MAG TPA: GntG family PLP-dependent aldolase [Candidatus Paceibacterota bacterium]|nr:GntG family PLP-dependent aldolase [Verrucomicrobiota bacterium]HRY47032.1 GntG family PLP-dependent aldolase [Candidatus Paceibacterota bacterium]
MHQNTIKAIDLRSDTVTRPSPAMLEAMVQAEVGDDVFGEDPTVNRLEKRVAEILGLEAAVFMPTGTMSNQAAVRAHTMPGDEIILEADAHIFRYEAGAPAALSGVMCQCIRGRRGLFTTAEMLAVVRASDLHFPVSRLVCLENTHNYGGGSIWPLDQLIDVVRAARQRGIKTHLDGARLWNASVATGIPESDYAREFDSVSVCFSKGLGAPVGSALAGSFDFVKKARRCRKQFGGGMRQAGLLAAAALYALEHHRSQLPQDHANARLLAEALATMTGIEVDLPDVVTNIVVFQVTSMPAPELAARLEKSGVRILARGPDTLRAVTHRDVSRDEIQQAIEIIQEICQRR